MQDEFYLTTEEAAAYLRVKTRKLYELATEGRIPCSKVTGKWLFPRAALDRWIAAGLSRPEGFADRIPPMIAGGSTDPLLEWAVRQSGSGLASLPEGSEAGLRRLAADDVALAAIHLHRAAGDDGDVNAAAVRATPGLHDAVVIAFAKREQGIVTAPGNPLGVTSLADAVAKDARVVHRQPGAGARLLLERLLSAGGTGARNVRAADGVASTGQDLALAIRSGGGDWGVVTRAVADTYGLPFQALAWEDFDLVLRRRTYFEPSLQALMRFLATPEFHDRAAALGGYDTTETGTIRLNA
ncbi:MAG: helix-turn-helix transcriptional regulator [Rhodospirillaceae bacterium]